MFPVVLAYKADGEKRLYFNYSIVNPSPNIVNLALNKLLTKLNSEIHLLHLNQYPEFCILEDLANLFQVMTF